ncbi:MAG: exodeoxyribonuclease III [Lachnospiraceae bacterium]|nr:exodeoxyribonuclease III [Lachnospiraceae bacterium]
MTKKLISWNVNGLRAVLGKNFYEAVEALKPDVLCLQETKLQAGQCELNLPEYHAYWNYAKKKGYSGTLVLTTEEPLSVTYGIGREEHDQEGRVITCEYPGEYLVCCYTPNSQDGLKRLDYRMRFEDDFRGYLTNLAAKKAVILCGDLNVAHQEIDLKNPSTNHQSAGFTDAERGKFSELLAAGFIDSFRYFNPELKEAYSWWSYRMRARERNAGWRIDYFVVSEGMKERLVSAAIHPEIFGSDHCPVELVIRA